MSVYSLFFVQSSRKQRLWPYDIRSAHNPAIRLHSVNSTPKSISSGSNVIFDKKQENYSLVPSEGVKNPPVGLVFAESSHRLVACKTHLRVPILRSCSIHEPNATAGRRIAWLKAVGGSLTLPRAIVLEPGANMTTPQPQPIAEGTSLTPVFPSKERHHRHCQTKITRERLC